MIIEAVVFALIADPLVISDSSDRSKGTTNAEHLNLLNLIRRRTFASHVQQLRAMRIVDAALADELDAFRNEIRNLVHLQNWDGRLYRQIPQADYTKHLQAFDRLLKSLNGAVKAEREFTDLTAYYLLDGRMLSGQVKFFNRNSGRGQIDAKGPHDYIPFFREDMIEGWSPRKGENITFTLAVTEPGIRAVTVKPA